MTDLFLVETVEQVTRELRNIAAELLGDVASYAEDMLSYILERIPEAGADPELRGLTLGACSSNLEAALSMVRHGIDVKAATAPVTAIEHARAMAARGYSVDVMLRFYRMGHAYFSEQLVSIVDGLVRDPALVVAVVGRLQGFAFAYVDQISSHVTQEYVTELDRRRQQTHAARIDMVSALVAGERVDANRAERILAHRLTGWQAGFVCWTDRDDVDLSSVGVAVAAQSGSGAPLLVSGGARALWGWVATTQPLGLTAESREALRSDRSARVWIAFGSPAKGLTGFRDSHLQAVRARRIIELSGTGPSTITYAEAALADVMSQDLSVARSLVLAELGQLAASGPREAEDRRTLLAVLDAQGGLAAAAKQLHVHRNTVLQRLRRAEERLGRPASERVVELHAALRLAQQLGPVVLGDVRDGQD